MLHSPLVLIQSRITLLYHLLHVYMYLLPNPPPSLSPLPSRLFQEAHKMIDFVLRHGNDLLAVESLKGFEGSLREQGKILRQGDLVVYEKHHKHKRRVFLFENTLILAKTKKPKNHPDIAGSEIFEFRSAYKVCVCVCRASFSVAFSYFDDFFFLLCCCFIIILFPSTPPPPPIDM